MLKSSGSNESKTRLGEGGVGVGGSKVGRKKKKLDGNELHSNEIDGGQVEDDEVGKKVQKRSKSKNLSKSTLDFFTPGAKLAFTKLRQAFFKAPILNHFDPEQHIRIEKDASGYAIGGVLSLLILDNMRQWHLVAFFFWKMILAVTKYETYNGELLAIVEAFKT